MSNTHLKSARGSTYRTPRWVKMSTFVVVVLVVLIIVVLATDLGGEHGPGRHTTSGVVAPIEQEMQPGSTTAHTAPIEHGN